jgi:hypothetical protein
VELDVNSEDDNSMSKRSCAYYVGIKNYLFFIFIYIHSLIAISGGYLDEAPAPTALALIFVLIMESTRVSDLVLFTPRGPDLG